MSFETDKSEGNRSERGPTTEAKVKINDEAISSGIGDRMLAKIMLERGRSNRPLQEGATADDCEFHLEIRNDSRYRDDAEQSISINIAFPSSVTTELTHGSWGVGAIEGEEIIFTPSFGANGDAPLSPEQKEVVRRLCSEALGLELKISEKISY